MNTIDTSLLTTPAPAGGIATNGSPDAERARVKDLAEQFESMLLSQMLKEMRRGMLSDDEHEDGLGAGAFTDAMDSQLGLALSKTGGMGIAEILKKAIDRQVGGAETVAPQLDVERPFQGRGLEIGATDRGAEGPALRNTEPANPITSNFGWRNDPISGQVRFHSGRDIKMAYGQDVRSAAAGTVTFAGERGGYGMTVEVDHGGGMVTRYAHLSSQAVAVGQTVESGQVIASSGNSGRSTGPHLHFEVLEHGRPVDPDTPIQGFSRVADFHNGRDLHGAGHSIG
jgi:murein DD-endopeptidase MepM/ murein hydrolase activator NlpD